MQRAALARPLCSGLRRRLSEQNEQQGQGERKDFFHLRHLQIKSRDPSLNVTLCRGHIRAVNADCIQNSRIIGQRGSQVTNGCGKAASSVCHKGDHRFAAPIILVRETQNGHGQRVPPVREAEKYNVVIIHTKLDLGIVKYHFELVSGQKL